MAQEREHATEFLKSLPVFAEIDDEELMKTVAKHFKRSKHAKGDVLAKEGEPQPGARPHSSCQALNLHSIYTTTAIKANFFFLILFILQLHD
jgi:hypothetical protein